MSNYTNDVFLLSAFDEKGNLEILLDAAGDMYQRLLYLNILKTCTAATQCASESFLCDAARVRTTDSFNVTICNNHLSLFGNASQNIANNNITSLVSEICQKNNTLFNNAEKCFPLPLPPHHTDYLPYYITAGVVGMLMLIALILYCTPQSCKDRILDPSGSSSFMKKWIDCSEEGTCYFLCFWINCGRRDGSEEMGHRGCFRFNCCSEDEDDNARDQRALPLLLDN